MISFLKKHHRIFPSVFWWPAGWLLNVCGLAAGVTGGPRGTAGNTGSRSGFSLPGGPGPRRGAAAAAPSAPRRRGPGIRGRRGRPGRGHRFPLAEASPTATVAARSLRGARCRHGSTHGATPATRRGPARSGPPQRGCPAARRAQPSRAEPGRGAARPAAAGRPPPPPCRGGAQADRSRRAAPAAGWRSAAAPGRSARRRPGRKKEATGGGRARAAAAGRLGGRARREGGRGAAAVHLPFPRRGRSGGVAAGSRLCGGGGPFPRGAARERRRPGGGWPGRGGGAGGSPLVGVGKAAAVLPGLRRSPSRPPPPPPALRFLSSPPLSWLPPSVSWRAWVRPRTRGGLFWGHPQDSLSAAGVAVGVLPLKAARLQAGARWAVVTQGQRPALGWHWTAWSLPVGCEPGGLLLEATAPRTAGEGPPRETYVLGTFSSLSSWPGPAGWGCAVLGLGSAFREAGWLPWLPVGHPVWCGAVGNAGSRGAGVDSLYSQGLLSPAVKPGLTVFCFLIKWKEYDRLGSKADRFGSSWLRCRAAGY